ncbi:hypothetical protein HI914_02082 [Erysiphe necator]|nr:hypothetical protein HI914_02082 [Erysiphe necator]
MRDLFYSSIPFRKRPTRAFKPSSISFSDESATGNVSAKTSSISIPNAESQPGPTLTNPDMILPHNEQESSVSMGLWTGNPNELQISSNDIKISSDLGLIISRTPFVYGAGTILSDIGEVTEAENTPSQTKSVSAEKKATKYQISNSDCKSSLTNGSGLYRKRVDLEHHRRKMSEESITSVTSNEPSNCIFKDSNDAASIDDSVFQGDDEESIFSSDSDDTVAPDKRNSWNEINKYDFDENSSAALNRKAELILQSAKKRLKSMEDNLNRARTSISQRKSHSATSIYSTNSLNRSTPSPSHSEFKKSELTDEKNLSKKPRESLSRPVSDGSFESWRSHDRTSTRSPLMTTINSAGLESQYRSKSVSPSILFPERTMRDQKGSTSSVTRPEDTCSSPPHERLSEIGDDFKSETFQQSCNKISEKNANQLGDIRVLTRSTSSLQMRDIEYQVEGLKGRLSRLRNRARDDSARRRSLQFFKTSSALTEDQSFIAECQKSQHDESSSIDFCAAQPISENLNESNKDKLDLEVNDVEKYFRSMDDPVQGLDFDKRLSNSSSGTETKPNEADYQNSLSEEDFISEDSESDASVYYDTTVSHEDREDAFDYEHFFLHSALGTIGQQRRDSFDSEGSVETTRGLSILSPRIPNSIESSGIHLRSTSTDTLSTMASFETAIESLGEDDYIGDNDADDFAVQGFQSFQESHNQLGFDSSGQTIEVQHIENYKILKPHLSIQHGYTSEDFPQNPPNKSSSFGSPFLRNGNKIGFFIASNMSKRRSCKASFYLHDTSSDRLFDHNTEMNSNLCSNSFQMDSEEVQSSDLFPPDIISAEDQMLIKRLLNSFGECVLGLQEADNVRDCRVWRRRLDAARRVLEGDEGAM